MTVPRVVSKSTKGICITSSVPRQCPWGAKSSVRRAASINSRLQKHCELSHVLLPILPSYYPVRNQLPSLLKPPGFSLSCDPLFARGFTTPLAPRISELDGATTSNRVADDEMSTIRVRILLNRVLAILITPSSCSRKTRFRRRRSGHHKPLHLKNKTDLVDHFRQRHVLRLPRQGRGILVDPRKSTNNIPPAIRIYSLY